RTGKSLRIWGDKWREAASSEETFAGSVGRIKKTCTPGSTRRDLAGKSWIIFKLTLRRLVVGFKVSGINVIEISRAPTNRPFSVGGDVPRKTDAGSNIICIRFWRGKK